MAVHTGQPPAPSSPHTRVLPVLHTSVPYVCISVFSCPVTRLASTIFGLYVLIAEMWMDLETVLQRGVSWKEKRRAFWSDH